VWHAGPVHWGRARQAKMGNNPTLRFYVYLLSNSENPNEGIIRVDVELPEDARKLSEFTNKEQAEAFAENAAIGFQSAGMIVVYDPNPDAVG
jgi:hypothetical protein